MAHPPRGMHNGPPSQRHGNVEDGEHPQPLLGGEEIGNHCWSNGGIACLPDPHQQSGTKQHPVVLQKRAVIH